MKPIVVKMEKGKMVEGREKVVSSLPDEGEVIVAFFQHRYPVPELYEIRDLYESMGNDTEDIEGLDELQKRISIALVDMAMLISIEESNYLDSKTGKEILREKVKNRIRKQQESIQEKYIDSYADRVAHEETEELKIAENNHFIALSNYKTIYRAFENLSQRIMDRLAYLKKIKIKSL